MLSTLHSAKVPNLIYEEDDLRKKEKYGVLESEDSLIEELEEEASLEDDLMTGMGQASDSQAEDSDMEDDLGEEDAETEAFSTLGGEIYEEACRIVDEIEANLSADLSEEILNKSLLQLGKDKECCLKLSMAWDEKYEEKYGEDEELIVKGYKDCWVEIMVSKFETFQLKVAALAKQNTAVLKAARVPMELLT